MKKLIVLLMSVMLILGVNSCRCTSDQKEVTPAVDSLAVTELVVENTISADKESEKWQNQHLKKNNKRNKNIKQENILVVKFVEDHTPSLKNMEFAEYVLENLQAKGKSLALRRQVGKEEIC